MSRKGRINEFGEFVRNVPSRVTNSSSSDESSANPILTFFGGFTGFAMFFNAFYLLFNLGEPGETSTNIGAILGLIYGFYSVRQVGLASSTWVISIIMMIVGGIIH